MLFNFVYLLPMTQAFWLNLRLGEHVELLNWTIHGTSGNKFNVFILIGPTSWFIYSFSAIFIFVNNYLKFLNSAY